MFKLAKRKEIDWPVTVNVPQDGGKTRPYTFTARFRVLTLPEQEEALKENPDLLDVVLIGWKEDLCDEAGAPIPFSAQAKAEILAEQYIRAGLFAAYNELLFGNAARRKN